MKYIIIICLLLTVLLGLRLLHYFSTQPVYKEGQKIVLEYTLLDEPQITQYGQTISIKNIKVYVKKYPEYHYGDSIRISGTLERPKNSSIQDRIMLNKQKNLIMKNPKIEAVKNMNSFVLAIPANMRQRVTTVFSTYLGKDESDLLLGIVFGIKGNMDKDFYNSLKTAGVMHVVAASGMNVSMVSNFLLVIFIIFLRRYVAISMTIIGIIGYAILSGLEPSIIRASIMACCTYSAMLLGRQSYPYLSLFLAGWIMLFLDPGLILDIGFRLSFLATWGILSIQPLFESISIFQKIKIPGLTDNLLTTMSAQAGTLPILITSFGLFSVLSVLINVIVLWTIPILMIFGACAAVCSMMLPDIASIFLYLSYPFLLFFKTVVLIAGSVIKPIEIHYISPNMVMGYYLVLISIVLYFNKQKRGNMLNSTQNKRRRL